MLATRRARLASVIQEEVSLLIQREVKDPRVQNALISNVEVSSDGSHATLYVTCFSANQDSEEETQEQKVEDALDGLRSAGGFLRRHLAQVLTVRHIPELSFKQDKGIENSLRVHELLKQVEGDLDKKKSES